jgi:prepilin-type N-terminal cleavage/methylation domain-containing protein/prepilin-type processing-associated H-X9-DG protein
MPRKRAFTLIELLVVVGIIAGLLALLAPTLSRARAQSKLVTCQSNLRTIGHGVQFYLDDNRDFFPDAPFYGCLGYVGRSVFHTVLGSQIPESERPLNEYFKVEASIAEGLSPTEDGRIHLFECPSDQGDAYFKLEGTYFVEHGTSYVYASDSSDPYVPTFGIQSCRGLPLTKVTCPAKKIVFQEPIFNPSFDMSDPLAHWHDTERHHGNLLFADGHADFLFTQIFEWDADPNEHNPYY